MNSICWPAPAKLNLFLHINGRRPDGYHELQTLFVILDQGDERQCPWGKRILDPGWHLGVDGSLYQSVGLEGA